MPNKPEFGEPWMLSEFGRFLGGAPWTLVAHIEPGMPVLVPNAKTKTWPREFAPASTSAERFRPRILKGTSSTPECRRSAVSDNPTPETHRYVGMWRPPWDRILEKWREFINCPISEIESYVDEFQDCYGEGLGFYSVGEEECENLRAAYIKGDFDVPQYERKSPNEIMQHSLWEPLKKEPGDLQYIKGPHVK